jgi:UDP-N-acetylglucosamine--N-acetylmuramyl-(pentapeptide) pyrophosphoryl-undecaprenol N-acetylglucosamine transferase
MRFLIAAAGTGGHVFPGLSVGEALLDRGVSRDDILYVGGDRLEADVYPREGFPFLQVELRGLQRSLTTRNLSIPRVVFEARNRIGEAIVGERIEVVLGMGGYVTIPTALAARRAKVPFMNSEQNAEAGLANRVSARWARRSFGSFPRTEGMPSAEWVGNPVRRQFWDFDRSGLRGEAADRYGVDAGAPVLGVFGGSLGAGVINEAVSRLVSNWDGPPLQVVHLVGERNHEDLASREAAGSVSWRRVAFEGSMDSFYAVCDLVIARAGGAVAELTATSTPAILVPGSFGSSGHQAANARFLTESGAAITLQEPELDRLPELVSSLLFDEASVRKMRVASAEIARPRAARTIAAAMLELAS